MSTVHKEERVSLNNGLEMAMALCGTDDNGYCYYSESDLDVTCKRCLKKIAKLNRVSEESE